jgi:cyclopropane-fatty-acyl-phospholipid synthase
MNRQLALATDALTYGVSYGYLKYLIASPVPLDPEATWADITHDPLPIIKWLTLRYPPEFARAWLLRHKQREDVRLGIAEHYDVSNAFYELFLDRRYMFYSCADFVQGTETLEEAQAKKADFLLRLIDPRPGEKILELGCGWGPMLKRILEATGDKGNLHGYTLSQEQVAYNEQHNGFHVEFQNFITADYPREHYDKIYSIGAWEHVRPHEVGPLLAKLYAALAPGGRLVNHFLCRLVDHLPASAVISQLFFPGAVNSSYRFHVRSFEAAGFRVTHTSVHDYRPTLRAWFERLTAQREQALKLVDVQTYNRFLVFFASAWRYFDEATGTVFRFVLQK